MDEIDKTIEEAKQVEKIYTEVVEDVLKLTDQEPIKIWLRPLSYPVEKARTWGVLRETYKLMIESGQSEEDANNTAYLASRLQTLFFVVRKGPEDKAPRLFENPRQLGAITPVEQERLFERWFTSFEMTEEDLGNSLRVKTNS